ncbi:MAG: sugar ABC transporter permease [Clostridiales bacterium]|nr:sugar ABC transporter permease [Clostridiales bacterium]
MHTDRGKFQHFLVFLLPTLLIYGTFIIYPIFSTLFNSFFHWTGLTAQKQFIGLDNYATLFSDPSFGQSVINNLWVIVCSVLVQIPLGLVMALIVGQAKRRTALYKVLYFIPYLMSTVAIGLTWGFLYDPMIGPINQVLRDLGINTMNLLWLGDKKTALISVLIVVVWNFAPFYMILFNASLSTISEDYYEAASIDGATVWQQFRAITLPLLIPSIVSAVTLSIVGSLKTFDLFFVMTRGGPGSATELMGTYMYKQGFSYFKMGYASSVAFTMFFVAVLSIVIVKFVQRKTMKEGAY